MDISNKRFAGWLLSLLLTASCISLGQATASSNLQGTITDRSGAAIVGAEVTVINAATGLTRTVKTGTDGSYRVDPLPVGIYNVRVAMRGFSTQTASKVETMVGSSTTQNFGLTVGAATE